MLNSAGNGVGPSGRQSWAKALNPGMVLPLRRACILILNRRYHIAEKIHPSAEEIWIFPLGRKNMDISPRQKKYRCPSRRLVNLLGYV